MADGRWRITVTAPDWGQDHLSLEAVVAFVDGELATGPHARAVQHLERCPECAAQVCGQRQARAELRTAGGPRMTSALLSSLRAIPHEAPLPEPPAGLAMTADGQLVSVVRPDRMPLPQGELPSAIPTPPHHAATRSRRPSARQRRIRFGTGVAVSGLALGALAFGAPALFPSPPPAPTDPAPAVDRGNPLRPGPPSVLDARFQLGPGNPNGAMSGPGPASVVR